MNNTTYHQILGPLYYRQYNNNISVFPYNLWSTITKNAIEDNDIKQIEDFTSNVINNEGGYLAMLTTSACRFLVVRLSGSMLALISSTTRMPLVTSEFGRFTKVSIPSNFFIKHAGLYIDIINGFSSFLFDDTDIEASVFGLGLGSLIGTPHITSMLYSYARPKELKDYIALSIPSLLVSSTGNFDNIFGISQNNLKPNDQAKFNEAIPSTASLQCVVDRFTRHPIKMFNWLSSGLDMSVVKRLLEHESLTNIYSSLNGFLSFSPESSQTIPGSGDALQMHE